MDRTLEPLSGINWSAAWLAPWRGTGERVALRCGAGLPLHDALNLEHGASVRFVEQQRLPPGVAYERYIFDSGMCPTRPGLHDFFNGLCWLQLPLAKQRLNALQAGQIAADAKASAVRGLVRDAITVFDENGLLLDAPPALWVALLERDWQRLFVELRPLWEQARVVVFGHALLEKLVKPRKDITAHVWRTHCPLDNLAETDAWLAEQFTAARFAAKPFTPLPVLGIPGWWPRNENFSFYDDSLVFRPLQKYSRK